MKKLTFLKKGMVAVAALLVCALTQEVKATSDVTIGPNNGSLITGQAGGNTGDSGYGRGMSAMWRHEQLALTMTTSDIAMLTSARRKPSWWCPCRRVTVLKVTDWLCSLISPVQSPCIKVKTAGA